MPLIEQGLAKRTDGKTRQDFEIRASLGVEIEPDVQKALDAMKPMVALFVGGMGSKDKNFHKDAMVDRGYGAEADRIQELYLAGHRDEAVAAVPDQYIDDENLIGSPERIKERWKPWLDSGVDSVSFTSANDEVIELMGKIGHG